MQNNKSFPPKKSHQSSLNEKLQMSVFMYHRYESTSSEEEEEEEEEEEDGTSSGESGEGECLDSTEEDEAALEDETSEEERNVNLDESDTDEETLRDTSYSCDAVKEKYVVTQSTRCDILCVAVDSVAGYCSQCESYLILLMTNSRSPHSHHDTCNKGEDYVQKVASCFVFQL